MKYIFEAPNDYKHLNNLHLRKAFESGEYTPSVFTDCGKVEDANLIFYIIDKYDEDGLMVTDTFLYESELEYLEDLNILNL